MSLRKRLEKYLSRLFLDRTVPTVERVRRILQEWEQALVLEEAFPRLRFAGGAVRRLAQPPLERLALAWVRPFASRTK
jgi:hypothetical protein